MKNPMQYLNKTDSLLIIIGPSGSGKSSVIHLLQKKGFIKITPSWTTRPPRPEENKGSIEHVFISDLEFSEREKAGFFLEAIQPFKLPFRYGLPKVEKGLEKVVSVVMLRANFIPLINKHYTNTTIYQIEDTYDKICKRLKKRELHGELTGSRLEDFEKEVKLGRRYVNRIFINTGRMESLVSEIIIALKQDFPI